MNFASLIFIPFLAVVLLLYWLVPNKFRWVVILISSYFFYAFLNYWLISLIIGTTLVSYGGALLIEKYENKKKIFLILTLIICFASLFVFKYLDFVIQTTGKAFSLMGLNVSFKPLNLILPVGISFYTFQTAAYVIDVYRGRIKAERHLGYYASFVSYFPQLVAGPIEKADKLLPELKKEHHLTFEDFSVGLKEFTIGFLKKIVIADFFVIYVNQIYDSLGSSSGIEIILATFLFGIVIYADFSGYSQIARGIGKWMGVDLSVNFDRPYLSSSFKEFWHRWHITLNNFFTDYVYIPMGGSQKGKVRKYLNIMVVFLLSGLWHGASIHFIIWGAVCGLILVLEDIISPFLWKNNAKPQLKKIISIIFVYLIINLCWIFFRCQSLSEIGTAFSRIFVYFGSGFDIAFFSTLNIILLFICLVVLVMSYYLPLLDKTNYLHYGLYFILIVSISIMYVYHLNQGGENEFIYFQF